MSEDTFTPTSDIPNHLVKAILVTFFCCLPLGIVSIVNAAQVNGAKESGDTARAQQLSNEANKWANYALIGWVIAMVAYVGLMVAGGMAGVALEGQ